MITYLSCDKFVGTDVSERNCKSDTRCHNSEQRKELFGGSVNFKQHSNHQKRIKRKYVQILSLSFLSGNLRKMLADVLLFTLKSMHTVNCGFFAYISQHVFCSPSKISGRCSNSFLNTEIFKRSIRADGYNKLKQLNRFPELYRHFTV